MKRVIEDTFPSSIRTEFTFIQESPFETILYVDGNVVLYETKSKCDDDGSQLTPLSLLEFCNEIGEAVNATKRVIVFDGLPPIQKLPEQIKRRKKRYETYSELQRGIAFDLGNQLFIKFLTETEELFTSRNWEVISHTIIGEGEQKIVEAIRSIDNITERINVVCWTKDWDMFVILLNVEINERPIAIYLQMALMDLDFLISINKCWIHLDKLNISSLHFMACAILFGSDFYPGVSNLKLTPPNMRSLLECEEFVKSENSSIVLNEDLLIDALQNLQGEAEDSNSSTDCHNSTRVKMITYSNVPSKKVEIEVTDCGGECLLCSPRKFCTQEQMISACHQYLNTYIWTLNYFSGYLKNNVCTSSPTTYIAFVSPTITALKRWLERYSLDKREYHIDIIEKETYKKALEKSFELEFFELQQCRYVVTYQNPIVCKSCDSLGIFI